MLGRGRRHLSGYGPSVAGEIVGLRELAKSADNLLWICPSSREAASSRANSFIDNMKSKSSRSALQKVARRLGRLLCRNRNTSCYRKLGEFFKDVAAGYENRDYEFRSNGELRVLEIMAGFKPKLVIDAGANIGDWSLSASRYLKEATLYSFEIAPSTFLELVENCRAESRVHPLNLGLDQEEGEVSLNLVGDGRHANSSIYPRDAGWAKVESVVKCKVTRLDSFLAEAKIDRVDFLKIDTEGMDFRVLNGAKKALSEGRIGAIQFEYGLVSVETRFLLRDFFEMLEGYGYAVGKIYPRYVDFRQYHRSMEDFIGPNFLAVRSENKEMVEAFRRVGS